MTVTVTVPMTVVMKRPQFDLLARQLRRRTDDKGADVAADVQQDGRAPARVRVLDGGHDTAGMPGVVW